MRLVVPHGGGELDASASTRGWRLTTRRVTGTLTLPAYSGAVLLNPRR
jgi:hypothetical protein